MLGALGASMVLFLLAGCGGGGDDSTTAEKATSGTGSSTNAPAARETVKQFAARFEDAAAAAAGGDCKTVESFNSLNLVTLPCGGKDGKAYADLEVTGTASFGTGGVVDFTDAEAPDGATLLIGLDQSGRYGVMASLVSGKEEVGTKPGQPAVSDKAVNNFVRAVRTEDCDAYFDQAFTFTQDKAKECKEEFASSTPDELAADPGANPTRLGGAAGFVFYRLATKPDGYRTIVTLPGSSPSEVVVLSYSARPTT